MSPAERSDQDRGNSQPQRTVPQGSRDESAGGTRVKLERENFIAAPKNQIMASLSDRVDDGEQRARFADFCRLIEGIYHFENHETANELKQDFRLFDSDGGVIQRCLLSDDQLLVAEDRFLANFRQLMEKGNFRPLTQQDVDVAEAEDYLFNLPVQTDWSKLDAGMLSRFYARHGYCRQGDPPHFADRIMIFRRGVGVDSTIGYLVLAKIDVLVSRTLVGAWRIASAVGGAVLSLIGKRQTIESEAAPKTSPPATLNQALGADETFAAGTASDATATDAAAAIDDTPSPFADRYIERKTLHSQGIKPWTLFQRTAIQEPTFEELVILFRFATPEDTPDPTDRDWAIHIKAFRDIPMADLEVVFPEKHISMKPLDLVKLIITGCVGVGVAMGKLLVAALNPILAAVALTTVAGYASRIFFGFKASKDRYNHLVTNSLYHKSLDNDLGVIFYLMDALEEQEFKETTLGYYVLWREGDMTKKELDLRCEKLLFELFGMEIDFEISDALAKLERDDLVTCDGERFHARPIGEALQRLDAKWDGFFRFATS